MPTLNHLKKGESLNDKQLVIINSDDRDLSEQNTSSFTYTFNEPLNRVSKIDVVNCKIPNTFYNINNDDVTLSITNQYLDPSTSTKINSKTENLNVDDNEIKNNIITSTNVINGSIYKTNTFRTIGNCSVLNVQTNLTNIFTIGTFDNILDCQNFTGSSSNNLLTNIGQNDVFVSTFTSENLFVNRFKIAGVVTEIKPTFDIIGNHMYGSFISTSVPIEFYNSTDALSSSLNTNGNYTVVILKCDLLGNVVWRTKITGLNTGNYDIFIKVDTINNVLYVSGTYTYDLTFYTTGDVVDTTLAINGTLNSFIAKYDLNGTIQWVSQIEGTCYLTDMVLNPITQNVIMTATFINTIYLKDTGNIVIKQITSLGINNIVVLEYDQLGMPLNLFLIGGTNNDNNTKIDITNTKLVVVGNFTSNPVQLFNTDGTVGAILENDDTFGNIFIAGYNVDNTMSSKTLQWSTRIESLLNMCSIKSVKFSIDTNINILGSYNGQLKFFQTGATSYVIGKDLINVSSDTYSFISQYTIDGLFNYRSYITTTSGSVDYSSLDIKSNYLVAGGYYNGEINIFNSNDVLEKTLINTGITNGFAVSYINNINNYTIDTTSLNKTIITKTLVGGDLNYTLNLNSLSQSLGFSTSKKFRALSLGSLINQDTFNISNLNDTLSILFHIGNPDTQTFVDTIVSFKLIYQISYTPYSLAFELSKIIKNTVSSNVFTYSQLYNAVIYNDEFHIFYLQFDINGTFTIQNTQLAIDLNLPINVVSPLAVIADNNTSTSTVTITDNSKLSLKITNDIITKKVINGSFQQAFPDISSKSGSLTMTAIPSIQLSATAGSILDNISNDLKVNDKITFDSPFIKKPISKNQFSHITFWQSIAMSADGSKQTAVVFGGQIYISSNSGNTWIPAYIQPTTNKRWQSVDMSADGTIQTAVAGTVLDNIGQIYISTDSGNTWALANSQPISANWRSVAMSSDGTKQTAVVYGGQIYISTDSGNTWNPATTQPVFADWRSVAMSDNGTKQTAVVYEGQIYISSDSGNTWSLAPTQPISAEWQSVAMSADGIIQTAVVFSGQIYISSDSGIIWNPATTQPAFADWRSVAMSADGTKQTAFVYGGQIYISSDSGNTWIATEQNKYWQSVAMSSNGFIQSACTHNGNIYISLDSGNTWFLPEFSILWSSVTMSADGSKQTAVVFGGQIYISSDSGNTWVAKESNRNWRSVAMSSDGTKQTAVVDSGQIYVSTDSGDTWVAKESNRIWMSVDISSDGSKQTAVVIGGQIYISSDSGNTWVAKESNRNWQSIDISADGSKQTAVVFGGQIYISSDSGDTWVAKESNRNWSSIAMSADGSKQTAVVNGGKIYISIDSGNTWTYKETNKNWISIAVSSNGAKQTAAVNRGQIYISTDSGDSWLAKNSNRYWKSVAMSADGIKRTAIVSIVIANIGQIYISSDSGNTWALANSQPISANWSSVAMSADGIIQTAVVNEGQIYISSDSGNTWSLAPTQPISAEWRSVTMSADGTKQTAVVNNGKIYISSDSGNTWNPSTIQLVSAIWQSVTMSADGTKQTAVVYNGKIYISSDSGNTWNPATTQPISAHWQSVTMSSDGTKQTAVVDGGQIYISSDSGDIWDLASTQPTSAFWSSVTMSSDGTKQTAAVIGGYIYVSSDSGNTWTYKDYGRIWKSVDMSADGTKQTAVVNEGQIYISTDSGNTWFKITIVPVISIPEKFSDSALSNDGNIQTLVSYQGFIYISNDYGNSWTSKESNRTWTAVAMSADGIIQTAVVYDGQIYLSTDSGDTWNPATSQPVSAYWQSIDISADGSKQTAVVFGGQIYISSDLGDTWVAKESNRNWSSIDISADGSKQTAVVFGGQIYISSDSGNTWISKESNRKWYSIAMSADGSKQTAVVNDGQIYISIDSGNTWISKESNRNWYSIAMSADGTKQTAVVNGGKIYISIDSGDTWTYAELNRTWRSVAMSADGMYTIASTDISTYICSFLELTLSLNVESIDDSSGLDKVYFKEITTNQLTILQNFNFADGYNYTIENITISGLTDLFVPPGNYTPLILKNTLNDLISAINPAFTNAFSYDDITGKFSFTSIYSGNVIEITSLLQQIGFNELPVSITANMPVVANGVVNTNFSGPNTLFIKSDILGRMRKHKTAYSKNNKLTNILTQLEYNETSNVYNVPTTVEIFLSRKDTIDVVDIQIVDQNGNIVNLNNNRIQIMMYFYSS